MRPCGPAGLADAPDHVALVHSRAFAQAAGKTAEVRVVSAEAALVLEHDHVAVAALPAGELDRAVCGRFDVRAGGRCVIDAFVRAPLLQDRMKAHREAGTDARKLERRAQEGLAQILAVGSVIAALAFGVLEPDRAVALALVDELGSEQASGPDGAALVIEHLVDHGE